MLTKPDRKHLHVFGQEFIYFAISYPQFAELKVACIELEADYPESR